MRSRGTQRVSIGSTEVHIVAASNYHHKMLVKYLQPHLARYNHQRLLIRASISLLQGSYNAETLSPATKHPIANKSVIRDACTTSKQINFLQ